MPKPLSKIFVTITDMLSKNEIKNVAIVSMKDKGEKCEVKILKNLLLLNLYQLRRKE